LDRVLSVSDTVDHRLKPQITDLKPESIGFPLSFWSRPSPDPVLYCGTHHGKLLHDPTASQNSIPRLILRSSHQTTRELLQLQRILRNTCEPNTSIFDITLFVMRSKKVKSTPITFLLLNNQQTVSLRRSGLKNIYKSWI